MKKNLFITCALGLLSCAFSVQASDPWNYYRAGSSYSSPSYTQKYDSTFGMSIKGVYGIAGDSDMPNLGGGLLSLNSYTETGDIVHELSLTAGLMSSDAKHFNAFDIGRELGYSDAQIQQFLNDKNITNVDLKIKYQTSIPLLAGYTLNLPLVQEKAYFYLGGKIGITFIHGKQQQRLIEKFGIIPLIELSVRELVLQNTMLILPFLLRLASVLPLVTKQI